MKRRNMFVTLAVALALVCGLTIGASASDTLKEITANLSYGITVKYNGEAQTLKDASGSTVYPIIYEGTTYLPIRAVSNMLGISVDWDQATQTVLLGESADGTDLIESFEPYTEYTRTPGYTGSLVPEFLQNSDKQSKLIGGETVSHWISLRVSHGNDKGRVCSFNLGGKYSTLTFKAYSEKDMTLVIKGDNDSILGEYDLKGGQVPQSFTVDLHNTTQLTFDCDKVATENYFMSPYRWNTYVFDAILK